MIKISSLSPTLRIRVINLPEFAASKLEQSLISSKIYNKKQNEIFSMAQESSVITWKEATKTNVASATVISF